ncbi:MAG: PQQ-binding-like beta-propeller repeat protein [Candidatus Micrarchaeaceae archaeon]
MARNKNDHSNALIFVAVSAGILIIFFLGVFGRNLYKSVNTQQVSNSINVFPLSQPPVYQLDANLYHTYSLNITINPINLNVSEAIFATPTIYGNKLLVTTFGLFKYLDSQRYDLTNGSVIAINLNTSKILWRHNFPDQIMTQPITVGNLVIIVMGNNLEAPMKYWNYAYAIIALNITNGKIVWQYNTTFTQIATPSYFNGEIIEPAMGGGGAIVLNATTGNYITTVLTNVPTTLSSPLVVNGTAYFGGGGANFSNGASTPQDFHFFAINLTTNKIIWNINFTHAGGGINDVTPAYWNGIIVTGYLFESVYGNPVIVGINSTTGKILWEVNENQVLNKTAVPDQPPLLPGTYINFTENSISPITIWHGIAFADSNFLGWLFAINITTGKPLWAVNTGQCESNPNVYNGTLIIANDYGVMFVVNATTGRIINETDIGIPHLENEFVLTKNYAIIGGLNGIIKSIPISALLSSNTNQSN